MTLPPSKFLPLSSLKGNRQMRKAFRIAAVTLLVLVALVGAGLFGVYQASRYVPKFYQTALQTDVHAQAEASEQLSSRVTMLYSDTRQQGNWSAVFTTEQINGWLAVDLEEKHRDAIPEEIRQPRVEIDDKLLKLAVRIEEENLTTVLTLGVEAYVDEPNVIALRFRKIRAGALPVPRSEVIKYVGQAAERLNLPLRWSQTEGDPVALVTLPQQRNEEKKLVRLENLELHEGELYLSGQTVEDSATDGPRTELRWPSRVAGGGARLQ